VRCFALSVLGLLVACDSSSGSSGKTDKTVESDRKLAGVFPDRFECKSILTDDEVKQILGAHQVAKSESATVPPRGVAKACEYRVTMPTVMEQWTFDFDCRDGMKERADKLFEQYRRTSAELVHAFDEASDAGIKPNDAGIVIKRPDDAFDVEVGAKALDHHGQGILFIDDDAPCYVRVVGADAPRRLALAKAIAAKLTFANAPMTPRPLQ
jgi:hypothetical protein